MAIDYTSSVSILDNLGNVLNGTNIKTPRVPDTAIITSIARPGISYDRVTRNILQEFQKTGIKITLEDGNPAPIQNMVGVIVKEIFKELHERARIDLTVPAGIPVIVSNQTGVSVGSTVNNSIGGVGLII